jgi:hypothetical protein
MQRAQAQANQPYQDYSGQRIAGLTGDQTQAMQGIMGLQTPYAEVSGANVANAAGLRALGYNYSPTSFNAQNVSAPQAAGATMQAAQSGYNPQLQQYLQGPAGQFGQAQADQYMSPYMQSVVDTQKAEAIRDAQKDQLGADLSAAKAGTYGGSRQLLAQTERERNLGTQLGNIQATGSQNAFQQAQAQYNADRAAQLGVSAANQQAQLGVQQLGTQTGAQMALANLSNAQQAAVQNQAAQLQTQGLNAQQALQAALANQQAGLQTQQMAEQSRQFGSQQGLAALQAATQAGQVTGNIGAQMGQSDLARLQAQLGVGQQQQQLSQAQLDQQYADFLRQRDYPMEQLSYYSNIVHGLPVTPNSTATTYAAPPSAASQIGGLGLGALGMYNMTK